MPTARLAATFELPPAYLSKQLQALASAGIVAPAPRPRGGSRLARTPEPITLLDIVTAIEGPDGALRCQGIRRRGVGAKVPPAQVSERCAVASAMRAADVAWRRAPADQVLADLQAAADRDAPQAAAMMRSWHAAGGAARA